MEMCQSPLIPRLGAGEDEARGGGVEVQARHRPVVVWVAHEQRRALAGEQGAAIVYTCTISKHSKIQWPCQGGGCGDCVPLHQEQAYRDRVARPRDEGAGECVHVHHEQTVRERAARPGIRVQRVYIGAIRVQANISETTGAALPVRGCHSRRLPSKDPVATVLPSGENPPHNTELECPLNTCEQGRVNNDRHVTRIKSARHVTGCHLTQELRI